MSQLLETKVSELMAHVKELEDEISSLNSTI
jgi:exonuclease VII small subunit